jgi:hypothetical protein
MTSSSIHYSLNNNNTRLSGSTRGRTQSPLPARYASSISSTPTGNAGQASIYKRQPSNTRYNPTNDIYSYNLSNAQSLTPASERQGQIAPQFQLAPSLAYKISSTKQQQQQQPKPTLNYDPSRSTNNSSLGKSNKLLSTYNKLSNTHNSNQAPLEENFKTLYLSNNESYAQAAPKISAYSNEGSLSRTIYSTSIDDYMGNKQPQLNKTPQPSYNGPTQFYAIQANNSSSSSYKSSNMLPSPSSTSSSSSSSPPLQTSSTKGYYSSGSSGSGYENKGAVGLKNLGNTVSRFGS